MQDQFSNIKYIDDNDKIVASAIAFHLVLMNCKNCLVSTSDFIFSFNTVLNVVCWFLILGNYGRIVFFKHVLNRCPTSVITILSFLFVFCLVTQINNPDLLTSTIFPYNYVRETVVTFLSYCLPCFVFCSVLQCPHSLLHALYKRVWILFIFSLVSFFLYTNGHSSSYDYSMSYANALGFSIFIFLFLFYERRKFCYAVASVVLLTCLIICGSRGPLIGIISLLFIYLLSPNGNLKVLLVRIISVLATIFLILQQGVITSNLISILDGFGIESRTLRMFSTGIINNDSGRTLYFSKVFDALNDSPVFGLGAFGGSVQVGLTHNLYLDIWANFGYIAGSVLILFSFYSLLKIWKTFPTYSLVIVFFSVIIFPRGFVGFDFWGTKELWILFGLMVSYYSRPQPTRSCVCKIGKKNE